MRQLVKAIVEGFVALLVAAALTIFVAFLIYSFLPEVLLTLLFSIPPFLWSLRDLWWTVSLVLAAMGIWAYLDEITGVDLYVGGVLRGRDTERRSVWRKTASPPRRAERNAGSGWFAPKTSGAVQRVSATSPDGSGAGILGATGRKTQGRSTGAAGRGATNTPASGGKSGSGVVGPRVSNVRHRRHP